MKNKMFGIFLVLLSVGMLLSIGETILFSHYPMKKLIVTSISRICIALIPLYFGLKIIKNSKQSDSSLN